MHTHQEHSHNKGVAADDAEELPVRSGHEAASAVPAMPPHRDPVCGMTVAADPDKEVRHEGRSYYF